MQKPIVVVGSINLDLVASAERIPSVGETITGREFKTFHGGKGANQAYAAARLGYPVHMVGCVGQDAFGSQLREGLASVGVKTDCVSTVEGSSGVALITTGGSGENSIVVVPGANGQLTPERLATANPALLQAGFLLAQLEVPLATVEALAALAAQHEIPLMLDPAPARALPASLLRQLAWITPNETEAQHLLGHALPQDDIGLEAAADELLERGVANVLLKLGARGCLIAQKGQLKQRVPAFTVTAVDTTAAGDAFNAAFAVGLLRGESPARSARFASAVAAISVTRPGAQPSMPTATEVEAFLRARS